MKTSKIIGIILLSLPILGVYVYLGFIDGWVNALLGFGSMVFAVLLIVAGDYFYTKED